MESNDRLKEVNIKNRMCHYFDDKIGDFDFDNIFIDEKSCKNIFLYSASYKTLFGLKLSCISFDGVREFIKVYDGIRYLLLFVSKKYDAFSNRIRYLLSQKSCITYVSFHNNLKIKIDSYGSLPLEKMLTLRSVIIIINSVLNKDQNQYCY